MAQMKKQRGNSPYRKYGKLPYKYSEAYYNWKKFIMRKAKQS